MLGNKIVIFEYKIFCLLVSLRVKIFIKVYFFDVIINLILY